MPHFIDLCRLLGEPWRGRRRRARGARHRWPLESTLWLLGVERARGLRISGFIRLVARPLGLAWWRAAANWRSFFLAVPTKNPLVVEVALELTARRDHERLDIGLLRDPSHVFAGKGSDKAIEFDRPAKQVLCGI